MIVFALNLIICSVTLYDNICYIYIYIYTNNFVTFVNNCEDANCFPQRKALLLKFWVLIGVITQLNIYYPLDRGFYNKVTTYLVKDVK